MICFPLDNTEYDASALGAWCGTRTRGVFGAEEHYGVTANGDMTVTVGAGLAWLKASEYWGVNAYEQTPQTLAVADADGTLARIDAVCIRLNKSLNRGELMIKQGDYAQQPPVVTPPQRDLSYDEIYVATIRVNAGVTSIEQADITDQRLNEEYCGIMRDGITRIPTNIEIPVPIVQGGTGAETVEQARANLGLLKLLWSGSWSSGSITVPDSDKYRLFVAEFSTWYGGVLLWKRAGGSIRGGLASAATSAHVTMGFAATTNGNVWTLDSSMSGLTHTPSSSHTTLTALTVSYIYGVV